MKKIFLIILLYMLFPMITYAVDYDITKYNIEANIENNGNVNVCEYIKLTGTFNGYIRDIYYKMGDNYYSPTNINNIEIYDLNTDTMSKGVIFTYDDYANNGESLKYNIKNYTNGSSIKMFNATNEGTKGFVLCYTLENGVLVHNDVAELYYNFIPDGFSDMLNDVSVKVNLPGKDETLRVWAHGALYGSVAKENSKTNSCLLAKIDYVNPGEVVNVRMTFDKKLVSSSTRFTNKNALESIIEEEQKLADTANRERQKQKLIIGFAIVEFIGFIIFLIYAVVRTYLKYDKEHKIEFNMEYYRDFPGYYGPETLEYLIKRKNTTNSYSASILNMIYKKCIQIEQTQDKKDYILTKAENFKEPLTKLEADILDFLINNIGNGTSVTLKEIKKYGKKESTASDFLNHFENWKNEVKKDSSQYNFFEERKVGTGVIVILLTIFTFIIGIITGIIITSFLSIWLGAGVSLYIFNISKRTKGGMLEYKKWMAFKKFLIDFGRFDEKELPEIILWEKYLVYATVLGVADKLSKTMKIKIEEFNNSYYTISDTILINHMLRNDFSSTINRSVANAYNTSRSTIAASSTSSGSGGGGGFSGGGSFSGGGGGGGGHGF